MTILLTDDALKQLKKEMSKDPKAIGIRLHLEKAGCTGYMYRLNVIEAIVDASDLCFDQGIKLYVAKKDYPLLTGTTIDFVREGINRIFKYHNPNETASCGCGESFMTGQKLSD